MFKLKLECMYKVNVVLVNFLLYSKKVQNKYLSILSEFYPICNYKTDFT